jgi:hypothetical protein
MKKGHPSGIFSFVSEYGVFFSTTRTKLGQLFVLCLFSRDRCHKKREEEQTRDMRPSIYIPLLTLVSI